MDLVDHYKYIRVKLLYDLKNTTKQDVRNEATNISRTEFDELFHDGLPTGDNVQHPAFIRLIEDPPPKLVHRG